MVIEQSPAHTAQEHDRCRQGLNHLAFNVEDATTVEKLVADATQHGWHLMYPERDPTPTADSTTPPTCRTTTASNLIGLPEH
ncbi:hypothetical protein ACFXDO_37385 [Streptomyces nigra]|uniref:hypothetical protein n=1 Tax=Streptomyces nigra TaxID=1827580 RepID=UPI0036D19050